jgi:hypothetical protein
MQLTKLLLLLQLLGELHLLLLLLLLCSLSLKLLLERLLLTQLQLQSMCLCLLLGLLLGCCRLLLSLRLCLCLLQLLQLHGLQVLATQAHACKGSCAVQTDTSKPCSLADLLWHAAIGNLL